MNHLANFVEQAETDTIGIIILGEIWSFFNVSTLLVVLNLFHLPRELGLVTVAIIYRGIERNSSTSEQLLCLTYVRPFLSGVLRT